MAGEHGNAPVFGSRRERRDADSDGRPSATLGVVAFGVAIVTLVVVAIGEFTAMSGEWVAATGLAYFAILVSIAAVCGGLAAVVMRRGRGWGIAAIVIAALASPLVLPHLLAWASGLG